MHLWTDEALIIDIAKYGDYDAMVLLFTPQHGVVRGIVKRGMTSKKRADMQPATLAQVEWKARLPEHMGTVELEVNHGFAARVMHDPLRLAAVGSVTALLGASLAERDPHPELYYAAIDFLRHVAAGVEPLVWMAEYVRLELMLLKEAGFGLDLASCAATGGVEELVYVSPNTGRAVSRGAGEPYHERMLGLPPFILHGNLPDEMAEITAGVALAGHFLETQLLPALHRRPPAMRAHFCGLLGKVAA